MDPGAAAAGADGVEHRGEGALGLAAPDILPVNEVSELPAARAAPRRARGEGAGGRSRERGLSELGRACRDERRDRIVPNEGDRVCFCVPRADLCDGEVTPGRRFSRKARLPGVSGNAWVWNYSSAPGAATQALLRSGPQIKRCGFRTASLRISRERR